MPRARGAEFAAMISRFHVAGMDCAAEEQIVRMRLDELGSINRIAVDLDTRHVTVDHDHPTIAEITSALQALGLGARHITDGASIAEPVDTARERSALIFAFVINAAFFVSELTIGLISASMGLIADALDMGADASVYALSLFAVGTTATRKKQLARRSGYLQAALATIGLAEVLRRTLFGSETPDPTSMIMISLLALAGNVAVLLVLQQVRSGEAHLQASWIFTANDIKVNLLVIASAIGVMLTDSAIPDLVAGAVIFAVVANGARTILNLSR